MKNISIIVAVDEENGIGKENQLLCYLPADLQWFKKNTSGKFVVMGRNTFLSLPKGALPNRTNIVISDQEQDQFDGCIMAHSIEDAIAKMSDENENFIIGGGAVYRQFFPYAEKLYITRIHQRFEADTFFPEISNSEWDKIYAEEYAADDKNYGHTYLIYKRNK